MSEDTVFQVGDKVWHINQYTYGSRNPKPFVVKDRYERNTPSGETTYLIQLGQANMLVLGSDLIKVVK